MLDNIAYRNCILEMLNEEISKDSSHITPEFSKYLVEELVVEREKMKLKALQEYSISCVNQSLSITDCHYDSIPQIDHLELPYMIKMDLDYPGLYGFDIQSRLNNGLKIELNKDNPNPFKIKIWLDMGAKMDNEVKNKLDSGLKRMIEDNNPTFAKGWLSLGGMIPDFQQKIDKGLQEATTVLNAKEWYQLGASVDSEVQLKLNEWLKQSLEQRHGSAVKDCLAMGATRENLQQLLDDCVSSMLLEDEPDSRDVISWKEAGADIKPEFQTILDSNLERVAKENIIVQFELWLELGANKTDEAKQLMNLAAQSYAKNNNAQGVKGWVDLGANNPFNQVDLNTMLQTEIRNDRPFSAGSLLELGAEVCSDIQAELNAGLLRAINNNGGPFLIKGWLEIGARLSPEQIVN